MSKLTINSNIASLNAQRNFGVATKNLSESLTRLSSGLRINKASDDAAGLAISSLLNVDTRVTNQGIRNINDGISYLNVAESALNELSNIVTRISELAEQGANGTLGSKQREALQGEVNSLQNEYNRIINTTAFNGNTILTGLTTNTILQGGYGVNGQLGAQVGEASLGLSSDLTRAGLTTRADTTSAGVNGNTGSFVEAISADGRYLAFGSVATNLVPGDTNGVADGFVKDTLTGLTTRVTTDSNGAEANAVAYMSGMSADGRYVVFRSAATNLVSGDTNGIGDAFIKDLQTGITTRVNTSSSGAEANNGTISTGISADGRYVSFYSAATNLVTGDTNGWGDGFVKDTLTGVTTRVTTSSTGVQGNAVSSQEMELSADGRYVAFYSAATNLVSGDSNGVADAFVKDTLTGNLTRVSTDSSGAQSNGAVTSITLSTNGRYVAFTSTASNLVAGDGNGVADGFVKDLQTGVTTRISISASGVEGNAASTVTSISSDGRYVTFSSSASNLVTGDTNGTIDSFVKDTVTGTVTRINVRSDGTEFTGNAGNSVVSDDGRYALFTDATAGLSYLRDLSEAGVQEISGMVVSDQVSARITLDLSRKYLNELSEYRAGIGASLSRASSFVNTLQVQSENYAAAASQITDVDVAGEASRLVANQILQRTAATILGQANLQPRLVLKLLEDI